MAVKPSKLILGPAAEPISLTEAKTFLRVDHSDDDTLITSLLTSAREWVERQCNRAMVTQTRDLALDAFPYDSSLDWPEQLLIPRYPLQSITSVSYYDEDGVLQTLSASEYQVDADAMPGRIHPAYDQNWPDTYAIPNAVRVRYVCGHATKVTVNQTTDVWTASGRTYADDDIVHLWNTGGGLPSGSSALTSYYVISASGSTFKLSTSSGGSALDISDAGTGTHFADLIPHEAFSLMRLLIAGFYEHREPVVTGLMVSEMKSAMAVESLRLALKVWQ